MLCLFLDYLHSDIDASFRFLLIAEHYHQWYFFACEKRGRELHAKYSFALSNLRFRWKEEKKKYSAKHKTMATWLIASLFARRFKFDMKKLKWNWLDCVYCFQRARGRLGGGLVNVYRYHSLPLKTAGEAEEKGENVLW